MPRKKAPFKKELRIQFSPEHFARLEKQAERLDQTASALVRAWAMERVTTLEALGAQTGTFDMINVLRELSDKVDESRE